MEKNFKILKNSVNSLSYFFVLFLSLSVFSQAQTPAMELWLENQASEFSISNGELYQHYATFNAAACDNAIPITSGSLVDEPLVCGNVNLLNSGSVSPFCIDDGPTGGVIPTNYGDGNEATYTYLASEDGTVDITIHGTTWTAIFVYDGCPISGGECVTASRSTTDSRSVSFEAEAGMEYFIWIDTWVSAGPNDPCIEGGKMDFSGPEPGGLEDCAGVPDSINLEYPTDVCGGINFMISPQDLDSESGLIYQWQSRPSDQDPEVDFTDISGASNKNLNVNGISEATDFRLKLTCDITDDEVFSEIATVTLKDASECYCTPPAPDFNTLYWIESVTTNNGVVDISNLNTCFSSGGYADYSEDHTVVLAPGQTFDFEVKSQNGASPGLKIWIDWNQNGFFEDSGELVYETTSGSSSSLNTYTGTITVPDDASLGNTRMRIRNYINQTPCNQTSYGETEDYSVQIVILEDCEGPVSAGTITDDFDICAGSSFSISVSDPSEPATGLIRQWQSSPAGEDDWTDIEGAHSTSYSVSSGIFEDTDYRFVVTCETDSDVSDILSVTLKPGNECYCTHTYTYGCNSDKITNVTLTGESNGIDNDSQCSSNYYGDYTDLTPADLAPGETYTLSVSTDYITPTSEQIKAWIDFNSNGVFEENELIANSNGAGLPGGTGNFDFIVPENVEPGNYRLRVRMVYGSNPTFDACDNQNYGETEDYMVEILQLDQCQGPVTAGTIEDDFDICAGSAFSISVSGPTDPADGLVRQWQSSPAGEDDWTDIEDAQSTSFNISSGIFEHTNFIYVVTCNDTDSDTSDILSVTLKPGNECYCTPTYTSGCNLDKITNVSLSGESNGIDNDSGCSPNYYGDYTDLTPADLAPGETYTLSVSTDYSSPTFEQVKAWIDYNDNGFFEDDELIADTNGAGLPGGTGNYDFIVPENTEPGNYRLRVRMVYVSSPTYDACNNQTNGETEDYMVEIIQLDDCQGPVTAGTIEDDFDICAGNAFSISVSGATAPANGLVRQWQSSPAGEDDWTDIEGAYSNSFNVADGIFEDTDFRYVITCNDDESDTSDIISVTLTPSAECYCIPEATDSARYINNFSTTGAINDISNLNSGFSSGGYGDFTDMTLSQ